MNAKSDRLLARAHPARYIGDGLHAAGDYGLRVGLAGEAERVIAGSRKIEVAWVRITKAGRRALETDDGNQKRRWAQTLASAWGAEAAIRRAYASMALTVCSCAMKPEEAVSLPATGAQSSAALQACRPALP